MLDFRTCDDFLSPQTLTDVDNYLDRVLVEDENNFSLSIKWQTGLHGAMLIPRSPIFIHHWKDDGLRERVHEEVNDYLHEFGHEVNNSIMHIMLQDAQIDWHSDQQEGRSGAVTIYLNRKWRVDFGGDLLYNTDIVRNAGASKHPDDFEIGRVTPKYNRAVYLEAGVDHKVTPVYENVLRKSIQLWLRRKD